MGCTRHQDEAIQGCVLDFLQQMVKLFAQDKDWVVHQLAMVGLKGFLQKTNFHKSSMQELLDPVRQELGCFLKQTVVDDCTTEEIKNRLQDDEHEWLCLGNKRKHATAFPSTEEAHLQEMLSERVKRLAADLNAIENLIAVQRCNVGSEQKQAMFLIGQRLVQDFGTSQVHSRSVC